MGMEIPLYEERDGLRNVEYSKTIIQSKNNPLSFQIKNKIEGVNVVIDSDGFIRSKESLLETKKMLQDELNLINNTLDLYKKKGDFSAAWNSKRYKEYELKYLSHYDRIKKDPDGFVYLMIDNSNGTYKIGFSKSPKRREKTLQSEKPVIQLVCYFSAKKSVESDLHELFHEHRIRGEWFKFNNKILKNVLAIYKNNKSVWI